MNTSSSITFLLGVVIVIGSLALAFMIYVFSKLIAETCAKRSERKALAQRDREMKRWGMKPFDQGRERVKS